VIGLLLTNASLIVGCGSGQETHEANSIDAPIGVESVIELWGVYVGASHLPPALNSQGTQSVAADQAYNLTSYCAKVDGQPRAGSGRSISP
jgi:hypothetical protein